MAQKMFVDAKLDEYLANEDQTEDSDHDREDPRGKERTADIEDRVTPPQHEERGGQSEHGSEEPMPVARRSVCRGTVHLWEMVHSNA